MAQVKWAGMHVTNDQRPLIFCNQGFKQKWPALEAEAASRRALRRAQSAHPLPSHSRAAATAANPHGAAGALPAEACWPAWATPVLRGSLLELWSTRLCCTCSPV